MLCLVRWHHLRNVIWMTHKSIWAVIGHLLCHHNKLVLALRVLHILKLLIKLAFELQVGLKERTYLFFHVKLVFCLFLLHQSKLGFLLLKL